MRADVRAAGIGVESGCRGIALLRQPLDARRRRRRVRPAAPSRSRAGRSRRRASRACGSDRRAPRGGLRPRRARAGPVSSRSARYAASDCGEIGDAVAEVGGLRGELVERGVVPALEGPAALGEQDADVGHVAVAREDLVGGARPPARSSSAFASRSARTASSASSPGCGAACSISASRDPQFVGLAGAHVAIVGEGGQLARQLAGPFEGRAVAPRGRSRRPGRRSGRARRAARRRCAGAAGRTGRAPRRVRRRDRRALRRARRRPPTLARLRPSLESERPTSSSARPRRSPRGHRRPRARGRRPRRLRARSTRRRPRPAPRRRGRRPESARWPSSSPRPVTTMVLPAPVSPVIAVKPGPIGSVASAMTPRSRRRISSITEPGRSHPS